MKLIPFSTHYGSPLTVRQILAYSVFDKVSPILAEMHGNSDNTEGYRKVYQTLLAKPATPPRYPVLMSFVPADSKFDAPDYIDLHFWNPSFVEPPAGSEPWYYSSELPRAGHYNANEDKYHQTLSMSFCKWEEAVDASVWIDDEKVRSLVPTIEHAAAQILWELTFYSFDEGKTQELWDKILEDVETFRLEAKKEKKKGA